MNRSQRGTDTPDTGGNLQMQARCKQMQTQHKIDVVGRAAKPQRSSRSGLNW